MSAAGLVGVSASGASLRAANSRSKSQPSPDRPAIQPEVEADVHQPRGVLRAFEIAADPVERVGDA